MRRGDANAAVGEVVVEAGPLMLTSGAIGTLLRLLEQFPATERGAQGLYWAAYETPGLSAKLAISTHPSPTPGGCRTGWPTSSWSPCRSTSSSTTRPRHSASASA